VGGVRNLKQLCVCVYVCVCVCVCVCVAEMVAKKLPDMGALVAFELLPCVDKAGEVEGGREPELAPF